MAGTTSKIVKSTGVSNSWASLIAAWLMALAGLFGLDAAIFRTNLYPSVLEPGSSTGQFELILWREKRAQKAHGDNLVVAIGDSRFAFLPRLANEITSQTGYVFRSAGVAGSDPHSWYYMLRDLDPKASRYRAIVFGLTGYDDADFIPDRADDIRALHYAIARLRLSDVPGFAASFHSLPLRWEALRGGLLKGLVYQRDVQAFLQNPGTRIDDIHLAHRPFMGYEQWTYDYVEDTRTMVGLEIDWPNRKFTLPPGANQNQHDTVNGELFPLLPRTRLGEFRRKWFGRIIRRYQGSRTKIIFVRLPRGPIPRPEVPGPKERSSIREFAARDNVALCEEHTFDFLEKPELFLDGVHLNREGIALFSPRLAREVSKILGGPPPSQP